MFGAIIGDIAGSTYEIHNVKTENFELIPSDSFFTDDTVLTVAVANKILNEKLSHISSRKAYAMWYRQYYRRYLNAGYGQMFSEWASSESFRIQRSFGNGGAMRVSAIGFAYDSITDIKREVKNSCYCTHNNHEAIRGAQAIATVIFMARKQCDKDEIKKYIQKNFKYKLNQTLDEIRDTYVFDSRASYSVPPAIEAFLESDSYEDALRKAISIGGDSDTIACMTGGIAQAYYKHIPEEIYNRAVVYLDSGLKKIASDFEVKFGVER